MEPYQLPLFVREGNVFGDFRKSLFDHWRAVSQRQKKEPEHNRPVKKELSNQQVCPQGILWSEAIFGGSSAERGWASAVSINLVLNHTQCAICESVFWQPFLIKLKGFPCSRSGKLYSTSSETSCKRKASSTGRKPRFVEKSCKLPTPGVVPLFDGL